MDSAMNAKRHLARLCDSLPKTSLLDIMNSLPPETQEYLDALLHRVSQEELPLVRSEIKRTAKRIYDNWASLESIVQRHEAKIQKRWANKSIAKRRDLLSAAWPNMARDQRPDIVLASKADDLAAKARLQGRPRQQAKQYEGSQREALLMPYMNQHNLTKTEPLLLMINARARRPPHEFWRRDIQLSTNRFELTKWRFLGGYVMDLNGRQSVPESYGEIIQEHNEYVPVVTGADPRVAGGMINPGDGLWAMEIQDRLYKFLLDIVQKILHDIPLGDLAGPDYNVQPEPPLPSANSRESPDGIVSLATTNLEAIYSSPTQMDLDRLQVLVTAKANEEEDKLWALREDPGRFSEELEDMLAHRPEYVQDLLGKQHPDITIEHEPWCDCHMKSLKDSLSTTCLMYSCANVEFWCGLLRDITALAELKAQHFDGKDVKPGAPLPEPFALELYKLQFVLWIFIEKRLSFLRIVAYSSPPLRPYMRRASTDTLDTFVFNSDKEPPRHILELMRIMVHLFSKEFLKKQGHIASVQLLLEQYDMFIDTVPDAQQAVSSQVAEEISHITLLSECLRQIYLFQSWDPVSKEGLSMKDVHAVFIAYMNEKADEAAPFANFVPSARTRSAAAAIANIPYPVHKKRTAANVHAMQHAETLLDQMWDGWLAEMEQQTGLPTHTKKVLFLQGRQLQRTPDWVEPEPVEPTMASPPNPSPEAPVQHFGGIGIDDNTKSPFRSAGKTKVKTRGIAAPQTSTLDQVETAEPEYRSTFHAIEVDRRAIKVFSALFHSPSSTSPPHEVPWNDFLHAMRSAGFWMEKLYGSVWQFAPRDNNNNVRMAAHMRSILFHEPHPHSRIPFRQARRHGRRLARAYGWSGQTFVLKHQ